MKFLIVLALFSGAIEAKAFGNDSAEWNVSAAMDDADDSTGEFAEYDFSSHEGLDSRSALSEEKTCIHSCKHIPIPTRDGRLIIFQEFSPSMPHAQKRALIKSCVQKCKLQYAK